MKIIKRTIYYVRKHIAYNNGKWLPML